MRKERSKIVDKAIQTVEGFEKVYKVIHQNTVLRGQSKSTFHNYLRRIAFISLHFGRLPENISDEEIREYLTGLALDPKSPSRSSFKHMVYGLRYYFRHISKQPGHCFTVA
ncbi:MAG: phage integrase N-terminal SAM-like domain-containing protein [Nitrosopumilus sp.]